MPKYYRVLKETPIWKTGAILTDEDKGEYVAIQDFWNVCKHQEYLSAPIVEAPENAEFFERVYKDSVSGMIFRTADQMKALYETAFK